MSEHIHQGAIKVIELVGISEESFEDAVHQAVRKASDSLENIRGVEIQKLSAKVSQSELLEFHADVKLAFVVQ